MKSKNWLLLIFSFLTFFQIKAQEITYGFKAGLNESIIIGENETDANGNELEDSELATGFHIGAAVTFKMTDYFGLRTELLFSQKGGRFTYDGPSYRYFTTADGQQILTRGNREVLLNVSNAYLDIPIMGYARVGRVEFSAGVNVGFLVVSSGEGELIYSGQTTTGSNVQEFATTLDYNFRNDEAGEAILALADQINIVLDGEDVSVPTSIGAYYEYEDRPSGNFYNTVDVGVNAGLSVYLNRSLYIGVRANYGLLDVTNEDYDISKLELDSSGGFIFREDDDRNFSVQASIGFNF